MQPNAASTTNIPARASLTSGTFDTDDNNHVNIHIHDNEHGTSQVVPNEQELDAMLDWRDVSDNSSNPAKDGDNDNDSGGEEESKPASTAAAAANGAADGKDAAAADVGQVAAQVQTELFLEGDDDDLDDLEDD